MKPSWQQQQQRQLEQQRRQQQQWAWQQQQQLGSQPRKPSCAARAWQTFIWLLLIAICVITVLVILNFQGPSFY